MSPFAASLLSAVRFGHMTTEAAINKATSRRDVAALRRALGVDVNNRPIQLPRPFQTSGQQNTGGDRV